MPLFRAWQYAATSSTFGAVKRFSLDTLVSFFNCLSFSLFMSELCTVVCTAFVLPFVLSFVPPFVLSFVGYKMLYFVHSPLFFDGMKSIRPICFSSALARIKAFSLIPIIPLIFTFVLENQSDQLHLLFIASNV